MTLSIVWMIMADHLRPWKQTQRAFHVVEDEKLRVAEQQKVQALKTTKQAELDKIEAEIKAAEQTQADNSRNIKLQDRELRRLEGTFQDLDTAARFQKAELDSLRSLYDGMIDRGEEREARAYIASTIVPAEAKLAEVKGKLEGATKVLAAGKAKLSDLKGNITALEKKRDDIRREVDRAGRVLAQKEAQFFGPMAFVRGLPGLDLAASPTRIQQISLPDLTINYNFKDVPRYDRCTTCHQGIDRLGYDVAPDGKTPMKEINPAFAAHPHLTDGATTIDPTGKVVPAGLYLDSNGPHGINKMGCTICHGGQGSGTDFTYSSHEPNDPEQKHKWEQDHAWREMHHWDEPMLPSRFIESSCIKCHHQVTDVPDAKKLQAGFERITKYGCTGCHTIGGEGSFGPDLTDARQVGPNLKHLASKVSKDWTARWIKNPHAFRPDTRMPRFYDVSNNASAKDQPKVAAEVHAMTHYLFSVSKPPEGFVDVPAKGDAAKGKETFLQKGCLACHAHKETGPATLPEGAKEYASADFGPNLSNISAKFGSKDDGFRWLANWVKAPEAYHAKSLMPNLQLSWQDSADIAAWILSIPGEWPGQVALEALDSPEVSKGLDELVKLYKSKTEAISELDGKVAAMTRDDKLMFLGKTTIGRLGCFGCHNIAGFEAYKPIGTPLNGWGAKSPTKLDYGHIAEYFIDQVPDDHGNRDGTDHYYQEKIEEHTRSGFLYQKLHRPRSYDFKKTNEDVKAWDERLRMPQFSWANDPKAIEEVMTFVLGLTGEKIASKYLPATTATPASNAVAEGRKLLSRYNCTGCHVLEMPKYTIAGATKFEEAFPTFETNVRVAYNARQTDYLAELYPKLTYDPKTQPTIGPVDGKPITFEAMPTGTFENELTVTLWRPTTIRGFTFNVGDTLTLDSTKVAKTPAVGGDFAWLSAAYQAEKTGTDYATFWNRLPPPLLREGLKVQTPWLTSFLKDPYQIRPAANLRMPKFHFGRVDELGPAETAGLANYFAANDGAEFPYQAIPEREQGYLTEAEAKHANYLGGGWQLMTKGACVGCHSIGAFKPNGGPQVVNGPDLRQVNNRFRPGYLAEWLANPKRLVPYTAMPQNVPPNGPPAVGVPKSMEGQTWVQVKAMRDTLLNYVNAVESQLAGAAPAPAAAPAEAPAAPKAPGASE
ncbi:c-type cytochrome [Isosphaeraceae bacterium EP7]